MTVGERIQLLRKKLGMSQVDFATKIDVSKQTLYKYENNLITNIPSDKIEAVAALCNVSPAYLMGWIDDESIGEAFYRTSINSIKKMITSEFGKEEAAHFELYTELTTSNQKKVDLYTRNLLSNQQMEYELNAAHERTDISITEDMKTHDNNIMMDDDEWE
nr:MAG TPA: hypothetical protein [Caudoviricetes sp.]